MSEHQTLVGDESQETATAVVSMLSSLEPLIPVGTTEKEPVLKEFRDEKLVEAVVEAMEQNGIKKMSPKPVDELLQDRLDSKVLIALIMWYFWSGCTLFTNKYVIDYRQGDSAILSCIQMSCALVLGFMQQRNPLGMFVVDDHGRNRIPYFTKNMVIIGSLRYITVFLGLYALKYVEVSFTETVKSTAPAFTMIISSLILGEKTSLLVKISILPVMGGLALCSASEAKFSLEGFAFALATNLTECLQNVLSKMVLNFQKTKYNPAEIQYHTSVASLVVQIPTLYLFSSGSGWEDLLNPHLGLCYLLNGIFFHFQTMYAYALMDAISPVSHSVANTLKRALLIWLSVIIFKNTITMFSGLGTTIVFLGVLFYNKARQWY